MMANAETYNTETYKGKVCVITGAASGIGRAMAVKLGQAGAALALSDVNQEGLAQTAALAGAGQSNQIITDVLDVADADAIEAYAQRVEAALGAADYLFNVAGLTRLGRFDETPLSSMEKIMEVNFWGVVRMSKAFLPQLKKTKGGLTNISSIFGVIGFHGQAHYCASKFAVRGFTETIAQELAEEGVRVSSVHPGGVATNIARNAQVDALPEGENREDFNKNFDAAAITSPEQAAQIILEGTAKGKRRIIVGKDAKVISFVQRLFPQSYAKWMKRFFGGALSKSE